MRERERERYGCTEEPRRKRERLRVHLVLYSLRDLNAFIVEHDDNNTNATELAKVFFLVFKSHDSVSVCRSADYDYLLPAKRLI